MELAKRCSPPLLTCEAVLAETAFHVRDTAATLGLVQEGFVDVAFDSSVHLPELTALAERYADRSPDLVDLCLIRISELFPSHAVFTVDRADFRVYRRNKREVIPVVTPPPAR